MFFADFRELLLDSIRARVRNGELTERSLAKLVGVSQPHVHNVLKGVRTLTPDLMDRFLYHFRLSALDLVEPSVLARYLGLERCAVSPCSYVPVVEGRIGPGSPWPVALDGHERFPVPSVLLRSSWNPVVVRLGVDVRMLPLFDEGDLALLNQSHKARSEFDDNGLYVIKRGPVGQIRRVRILERAVYLVTEDCVDRPGLWERLPVEGRHPSHLVRARAVLMAREVEWTS